MKTIFLHLRLVCAALACALSATTYAIESTTPSPKKENKQRTFVLWGHIRDSFTKAPVRDVKVTLMRNDSTIIDSCDAQTNMSNATGNGDTWYRFTRPAVAQKLIIRASHPEYEDCYVNYDITHVARNRFFDAPWHYMKRRSRAQTDYDMTLDSVVVTGTRVKMTYKGDTLVFDAAAFKLPDGSMLDALVRQMQGAQLDNDGTITINGRKIDYLMLNGKDFFKGKNKVMLDNLPYYTVNNIQVYERMTDKSRFLGKNIEQKEYVMDVNMKREYRKGYLGNAGAGISSDGKYMARAFVNRFTDLSHVATYANINDINETANPDGQGNWNNNASYEGKVTYRTAGVSIRNDGKDKWHENTLNVQGQWRDKGSHVSTNKETPLANSSSYSVSEQGTGNRSRAMTLTNTFRLKLPVWLESHTEMELSDYRNDDAYSLNTFNNPMKTTDYMVNMTRKLSHAYTRQTYFSERTTFNKKLPWGDNFEMEGRATYTNKKSDTNEDYRLDYAHGAADNRLTYSKEPTRKLYLYGRGEYYINALNDWTWRFYSLYEYRHDDTPRHYYRLDRLPGWTAGGHPLGDLPGADSLALALSPNESHTLKHTTGKLNYGFNIYLERQSDSTYTWLRFHLPLYHVNEKMRYEKTEVDTCAERSRFLLDGNINFTHKWRGKRNSLSANLWHTSVLPDLAATLVFDYSNPLSLQLRNKDIRSAEKWQTSFAYRHTSPDKKTTFSTNTTLTYVSRPHQQAVMYNPGNGAYAYKNVNGRYSCSWYNYAQITGAAGRWTYTTGTYCNFEKGQTAEISWQTDECALYGAKSLNIGPRANATYQHRSLAVDITGAYYSGWAKYETKRMPDLHVYTFNVSLNARYTIPVLELQVASNLEWKRSVSNLEDMPSVERCFWHASISRSFTKEKSIVLKLTAVDILHTVKNLDYSFDTDSREMTTSETERNGSYMLLSATYNFFKK